MPAVGIWGGERVEAWSLTEEEWLLVRATYRDRGLTMTCGQPGEPVKRQGTRYFRHRKGDNCGLHEGGQESAEHLRTKELVAEVARSLGWTATIEAPAPDRSWIADVLLEKGDVKLAMEVQWAAQTELDFRRRTERYERDGVICHWLVGPKNHGRASNATEIQGTVEELSIAVPSGLGGSEHLPMVDGLTVLLNGSLQSRYEPLVYEVEIGTARGRCYKTECRAWFSYWFIRSAGMWSRCGLQGIVGLAQEYPLHAAPRLMEQAMESQVIKAIYRSDLPNATEYSRTYSKIMGKYYQAQTCPRCRAPQGDGFIARNPPSWVFYKVPIASILPPLNPEFSETQHQCIDRGHGRCDQQWGAGFKHLSPPTHPPFPGTKYGRIKAHLLPTRRKRAT